MSAATTTKPKVGEAFNPWRGECGFYPPDVVAEFPQPIKGQPAKPFELGDGPKRVYERLVRYAGKDGLCYPSHERLSQKLGKGERQIRKDLQALEAAGLIEWQRRGRIKGGNGGSNIYRFLWHPAFDRNSSSTQNDDPDGYERNSSSDQKPVMTGTREHFDRNSTVILTGTQVPTNSVQEFNTEKSSSLEETDTTTPRERERTTTPSVPSQTQADPEPKPERKPEPTTKGEPATKAERWWIQEQLDEARQSLLDDFNPPSWDTDRSRSTKPDIQITTRILAKVANLDDWHAYLDYRKLRAKQTTKRSYGFYLADIAEWQENRETLDAEVAELRAERERNDPATKRRQLYEHLALVASECAAQGWTPMSPHLTAENDRAARSNPDDHWSTFYRNTPEEEIPSSCTTCAGYGRNPKTGKYCQHCGQGQSAHRAAADKVDRACRANGWKRREHNSRCLRCVGYGRDHETEAICTCAAGKDLAEELDRCPKCGHDGVVTTWKLGQPSLSAWCECHHANRRKQEEPGYVERLNGAEAEFWAKTRAKAEAADNPPKRGMATAAASIHGVLAAGAAAVAVAS